MAKRRSRHDVIGKLTDLLEKRIKAHPAKHKLTDKLVKLLSETRGKGAPDPTGACLIDGVCVNGMTDFDCQAAGGVYEGDGTTCPLLRRKT